MTTTPDPLVGDEARDLVERDYAAIAPEDLPLWERAKALKLLGRECDSFTRLGAGFLAWILGVGAAAGLAVVVANDVPLWGRALGLIAGVGLGLVAWGLGRRVWKAGRRVVDAFCWWTLLPERMPGGGAGVDEWRAEPVRDAVRARVFVFEGWRALRIAAATVSVLAPIVYLDTLDRGPRFSWYDGQTAALTVFSLLFLVIGIGTGAVLIWGQYRASRAHAERDPIQRWLLRR